MQKNIYIKSMLRQPFRSLLMVLLIATASFTFVVRAVEFIIVRDRIAEMSAFFHTVGFLSHRDEYVADVSQAIEVIAQSPYVSSYDRRRGFEGVLVDMQNAYIEGSRYWRASTFYNHFYGNEMFDGYLATFRTYIDLLPRLRPVDGFAGFVSGDSFFYGELLDIRVVSFPAWGFSDGFVPHKLLEVRVDDVLQGYPERVHDGRIVLLRVDASFWVVNEEMHLVWPFDIEAMEIGQRYFFKGTFYWMLEQMQVYSRTITMFMRPLGNNNLWYIPVIPGETIDIEAIEGLSHQLSFTRHVQSAVYLRTTRDMTSLPFTQVGRGLKTIRDGRFIDKDDYLNVNPVVVIHSHFADRRQVGIGDTITMTVNADQHLVYSPYYLLVNFHDAPLTEISTIIPELGVLSVPGAYPYMTLELEVVGIFDLFRFRPIYTGWSSLNKYMYIPDSLIPADWGLQSAHFGEIGADYSPALWYSFTIDNPRDRNAFLWDMRETLASMGFRVHFVGRDGSGFFAAADTILLSIAINMAMFSIVLILVLTFTVALFMWQRNKEYAISRAIGRSAKSMYFCSTVALLVFGVPSVIFGSIAGWFFAIQLATDAVYGFGEIIASEVGTHLMTSDREALIAYYMESDLPPMTYLAALCAIIIFTMFMLATIGNLHISRRSVLETLKGAR